MTIITFFIYLKEDVKTLLAKFCEKLNIIEPYAQKLGFYEREITFKHHEVFYRFDCIDIKSN